MSPSADNRNDDRTDTNRVPVAPRTEIGMTKHEARYRALLGIPDHESLIGMVTGKQLGIGGARKFGVPLMLAMAIAGTALASVLLPHSPGQVSYLGLAIGAGVSTAMLQSAARRWRAGASEESGMVLLALTDQHLYRRDQATMSTVATPLTTIRSASLMEHNRVFLRTWQIYIAFNDPRPLMQVWVSCLGMGRTIDRVRKFGRELASSVHRG
jgi:hypothetical protein